MVAKVATRAVKVAKEPTMATPVAKVARVVTKEAKVARVDTLVDMEAREAKVDTLLDLDLVLVLVSRVAKVIIHVLDLRRWGLVLPHNNKTLLIMVDLRQELCNTVMVMVVLLLVRLMLILLLVVV